MGIFGISSGLGVLFSTKALNFSIRIFQYIAPPVDLTPTLTLSARGPFEFGDNVRLPLANKLSLRSCRAEAAHLTRELDNRLVVTQLSHHSLGIVTHYPSLGLHHEGEESRGDDRQLGRELR